MLYVTHKDGSENTWHIKESLYCPLETIREIQADCDELEYILKVCPWLPPSDQFRVRTISGPSATAVVAVILAEHPPF